MKNTASDGTGLSRLEISFSFKPKNRRKSDNHPHEVDRTIEPGNLPRISKLMALAIRFDGLVRRGEAGVNRVTVVVDLSACGHAQAGTREQEPYTFESGCTEVVRRALKTVTGLLPAFGGLAKSKKRFFQGLAYG